MDDLKKEHCIDSDKKVAKELAGVVKEKWFELTEEELKQAVARSLKEEIVELNSWDSKGWGKMEKLRKDLKQYLGE